VAIATTVRRLATENLFQSAGSIVQDVVLAEESNAFVVAPNINNLVSYLILEYPITRPICIDNDS